jgi:hypothetical protein
MGTIAMHVHNCYIVCLNGYKTVKETCICFLLFQLRDLVAQKFSAPIEQLCLIFAGKILKDDETLVQHSIKDGMTVHLVIKSANRVFIKHTTLKICNCFLS